MTDRWTTERDYECNDWNIKRDGIGMHATEVVECLNDLTARLAEAQALAAKRYSDIERLESELEQSRKLFKTANEGFIRRTRERDAAMRVARDYKDKYDAAKETE